MISVIAALGGCHRLAGAHGGARVVAAHGGASPYETRGAQIDPSCLLTGGNFFLETVKCGVTNPARPRSERRPGSGTKWSMRWLRRAAARWSRLVAHSRGRLNRRRRSGTVTVSDRASSRGTVSSGAGLCPLRHRASRSHDSDCRDVIVPRRHASARLVGGNRGRTSVAETSALVVSAAITPFFHVDGESHRVASGARRSSYALNPWQPC